MHVNARAQDTCIPPRGSVAQLAMFFEQQHLCSPLTRAQCSAETSYATANHNYINRLCWQHPDIRQFQFSMNGRVEVLPPGYLLIKATFITRCKMRHEPEQLSRSQ